MIWSWKKGDPEEVLAAEMCEMKQDSKVLQLEELDGAGEGGATSDNVSEAGTEDGKDEEHLNNNNESPIEKTGM